MDDDMQPRVLLDRDCGIVLVTSSSADSIDSEIQNKDTLPTLNVDINLKDRYQGFQMLGYGNCGIVIKALDQVNRTIVAIKIYREGDRYDRNAKHEKYILDCLEQNPVDGFSHIVRCTDYFKHDNKSCIVLEKLGHSLKHVIKKYKNGLNRNTVRIIISSVMRGLKCLHKNGMIHSDLKPSNIARKYNNCFECKILDVGSTFFATSYTLGETVQTPVYRAPEVFLGAPVTDKIDIWSVGLITAELVNGTTLIRGLTYNEQMYNYISYFGMPPKEILDESLFFNKYFVNWGPDVKFHRLANGYLYNKSTKRLQDILKIKKDPFLLDFIEKCLLIDPTKRLSAKEALKHPFLNKKKSKSLTPAQGPRSKCTIV